MARAVAPVYSEDRARRLRMVLYVVLGLGVLTVVFAAVVLADADRRAAGAFALAVGAVLVAASGTALRLLPARERPAKVATVATGVLCVLAGLALAGTWLAFLLPLLGLGVLFLALVADEPQARPR